MPTTFTGLLLLIVLVLPGTAFVAARERRRPTMRRSALRETANVLMASAFFDVLTLGLFGLSRLAWPGRTFDIGALVRGGGPYVREHYLAVMLWGVGLVTFAVALGVLGGLGAGKIGRLHPTSGSGWWFIFENYRPRKDLDVHVALILDDGSRLDGRLLSFNYAVEESLDREVVLGDPIRFANSADTDVTTLDVSAVSVSAHRIVTLMATYMPAGYSDQWKPASEPEEEKPLEEVPTAASSSSSEATEGAQPSDSPSPAAQSS
jgi:hypothetical protein